MKVSMRLKLFIYMIMSILLFAVLLFGSNSFFAEKYYINNKKDNLIKYGKELSILIEAKSVEEDFAEETLLMNIRKLEKQVGGTIIIGNAVGDIYYPLNTGHENPGIYRLMQSNLQKFPHDNLEGWEIYNDNSYFFTTKDPDFQIDTLSFFIQTENGVTMLIWVPMAGISENAALSNRFTVIVGLITIIISGAWSLLLSNKFTKPIKEMNKITKQMSHLDFSQTLEINSTDELGELSNSINHLSDSLDFSIHELNQKNEELQKDINYERNLDKIRKELVSNVSHELKTPIFLIQGYAEGLKANIATDQDRKDFYCEVIMEETEKMNILIKDILDLSHLESGMFPIQKTTLDVSALLHIILKKYKQLFNEKEFIVDTEIENEVMIYADMIRVEQIIINYINNAINHTDKNKRIKITLKEVNQAARFSIYNSGEPIPQKDMENIWTSFYKSDKARVREYGGTGLGLSIVRAIQEAHGNTYGVTNLIKGVMFWCEFKKE